MPFLLHIVSIFLEDNYVRNYVDSPPIRFTIFDIETKSFIKTKTIRDIYNMYIHQLV
jgi:hypothetical protein